MYRLILTTAHTDTTDGNYEIDLYYLSSNILIFVYDFWNSYYNTSIVCYLSIYLSIYRHTPTFIVIVSLRCHTRSVSYHYHHYHYLGY